MQPPIQKPRVPPKMPPPLPSPRGPLWRRTPPAVFAPVMGLFGLALAWKRAETAFALPSGLAELILGAVALLFAFLALSYVAKIVARPGALIEDLRILPGRLGLSAMAMSVMLLAAGLVPLAPLAAAVLLWAGLVLHAAVAALAIWIIASGPAEGRRITPVWHLTFVGFVVAPLAAIPLGFETLALIAHLGTMPVAALIYAVSLVQVWRRPPPAPLRPILAIHLAPLALFGTVFALRGYPAQASTFAVAGLVLLAVLLALGLGRGRWLIAAGFSPFWGAFTFPLAAFASLLMLVADQSALFRLAGAIALAGATLLIPWIAVRVLKMWAKGALAAKTNASVA